MDTNKLQLLNLGEKPNDGLGDTIRNASDKINYNFIIIGNLLAIEFETVIWEKFEDTKKAMETVNKNFIYYNEEWNTEKE
jgi:hypothetical protein